jgi:hypothetical protein
MVRQLTVMPLPTLKPSALISPSNTGGVFRPADFAGKAWGPFRGFVVSAFLIIARRPFSGKQPQSSAEPSSRADHSPNGGIAPKPLGAASPNW